MGAGRADAAPSERFRVVDGDLATGAAMVDARRQYTGVALNKRDGRWKARYCRTDGKRVWLKETFGSAEEAAKAYDKAVLEDGLPAQPLNFASRTAEPAKTGPPQSIQALQERVQQAKQQAKQPAKRPAPAPPAAAPTPKMARREPTVAPGSAAPVAAAQEAALEPPSFAGRAAISLEDVANDTMRDIIPLVEMCYKHAGFERYFKPLLKTAVENRAAWSTTSSKDQGNKPRLLGLDCEMVLCKPKNNPAAEATSVLARVSLVRSKVNRNSKGALEKVVSVLLDEYVKIPEDMEVVDYLTHVSGVTAEHLDKVTTTQADVKQTLLGLVHPNDIIVGHSLWSDFEALRIWHANFVDTSALCSVRGLPNLTLSLKDLAARVLSDKAEQAEFQSAGAAHDSVADATWAIKVLLRLIKLAKKESIALPFVLDEIPERYRSRLTFHQIPFGFDNTVVEEMIESLAPAGGEEAEVASETKAAEAENTFEVRPLRWNKRRDGSHTGSCVVDCPSPDFARRIFDKLQVAQAGCGGYEKSGPAHPDGYPDRQGMLRKLVVLPADAMVEGAPQWSERFGPTCEVTSFVPVELPVEKTVRIKAQYMGRVMGRAGRTILYMQQVSGARIRVGRQPDRSSTDKALSQTGEFVVEADIQEKADFGAQLVFKAARKQLGFEQL